MSSGLSATNQYQLKTTSNAKRAKVAKKIGWIRCFAGFAAFAFHVGRSRFSGYGSLLVVADRGAVRLEPDTAVEVP